MLVIVIIGILYRNEMSSGQRYCKGCSAIQTASAIRSFSQIVFRPLYFFENGFVDSSI